LEVAEPDEPAIEGPVTVERLRDALLYNRIRSIRSEVDVRVRKDGKKKGSFKGAFLYGSPGSIRLRLYDPFGETVMDMVKSGSMMQVYLPTSNTLFEGRTPPLGLPPDALFGMEEYEDSYVLYVFRPGSDAPGRDIMELASKYYFSRRTLRNTRMVIYANGGRFMEISLEAYSGRAPGRMELSFFNGFSLILDLKEPSVDSGLSREFFAPMPHNGKYVQPLHPLFKDPLL
jgi:hypothetical protein